MFAPGETTKSVAVPVSGDVEVEGDEFFALRLSAPAGAGITVPEAEARIAEDDADPVPTTAADCMNDRWRSLARGDGSSFKNQGDCIQFVNTGM